MRDTRAALPAAAIDHAAGVGIRRRQRAADRRQGRMQPGADLLPLRLGGRPADGRARGCRARGGWRPTVSCSSAAARWASSIDGARAVFEADLNAGHVTVLVEMISGAQSAARAGRAGQRLPSRPGGRSPSRRSAMCWPRRRSGRWCRRARSRTRWWPGILGLEMLANLDGDRTGALALFDRAHAVAGLLDRIRPLAALLNLSPLPAPPARPEALCRPTW